MKKPLKHVNFRLTDNDRAALEHRAALDGTTISETVRKLLFDITHYLQTRPAPEPLLMLRYHPMGSCTSKLDVKVPTMITDYLTFNGYNITTCLLYQLHGN